MEINTNPFLKLVDINMVFVNIIYLHNKIEGSDLDANICI